LESKVKEVTLHKKIGLETQNQEEFTMSENQRRILVIRHAVKGDGVTRPKNQLSVQGEIDARKFGENLPESMKNAPITHAGGSIHSRTTHTAILIALGSGVDPKILPSQEGLGSEAKFFELIGLDMEGYKKALPKYASEIDMVRALCSPEAYEAFVSEMLLAIQVGNSLAEGNSVLGTHTPWLPMLFEHLTGTIYHGSAKELDYIVVEVVDDKVKLVETNLPM